jgi:molybdopterin-binding protein
VFACIHAEEVSLSREAPHWTSVRNRLSGRVVAVTPEGPLARVELDCGFPLVAIITGQSAADLALKAGDDVCASVKATAVKAVSWQ